MKKKLFLLTVLLTCLCTCKKVYAFDVNDYRYRAVCGNYEVAGFHADGYIDTVECFNDFGQAQSFMKNNGAYDLALMTKVNGETKIIDANMALLDLTVNPTQLTYFYENSELTSRQYTYMDTGSLYGGVDGGLLDVGWSNAKGKWVAKVRIGNFTGWIPSEAYEIVPLTWLKSYSAYVVTNDSIRHDYVSKIQNDYKSAGGNTIGPKPEMLSPGRYFSYDGHYFYSVLEQLMKDYKAGTHKNAVNANNPYYNYYMYLSNHTKTAYSSVNIDEYIRNNMGYNKDVFGHVASANTSRLYGSGTFFYFSQQKYGVNAILSLSLSRNETGNGRSYLAVNKNNGFGLNAVDSNPINGASWYATYGSSILGYASKWVTYGFAHPRDWRYFGPQFGDKWVGMNVKYASDTYWSEKMASNYYSLDKAYGLQDYNYYQLGVLTQKAQAYSGPSTSSKWIYEYPEAEDAVVIVGEVKNGNETWYKLQSDLNIDANYNEITYGDYNWNGYVYVNAQYIKKINTGKNGYIAPTEVTEYQDSHYDYNLYVENTEFKPRVGISTKTTAYYYDSSLTSLKGQNLLKDRYVIVYAVAAEHGQPLAYLVTSDYYYSQKHWVAADAIKLTNIPYGKVTVDTDDNQYTWVNYNTEDKAYSKISGLYTYSIVPILDSTTVNGEVWYKVPVSLSSNDNVYGYTLAKYSNYIHIDVSSTIVEKHPPVITAADKEMMVGTEFNPLDGITAWDNEDGDLTNKIIVTVNTVNTTTPGNYEVTYSVTDSDNQTATKTTQVVVKKDQEPVINASNKTIKKNSTFNPLEGVTATDPEDGDITNKIEVVTNTVDTTKSGTYEVTYKVKDSKNNEVQKTITIKVVEEENPSYTEEEGEFYLESLEWDKNNKQFIISGYEIILNQDNRNKTYYLVLKDKNQEENYRIPIDRWEEGKYDLGTENGHSYTDSWFKGIINFTDISNGDYELYMTAYSNDYYTTQKVTNLFNKTITKRGNDSNHGYNFKVLNTTKTKQMELEIRNEVYTTSQAPTYRKMVNEFEVIEFNNNKLRIQGYSYNYGGVYANQVSITRKIILEKTDTYEQAIFDVGSTKGPYTLNIADKLDKTYAWYDKELDLSNLEEGTYSIQVYTKTTNAEDYGELSDMFKVLKKTTTINGKEVTITYNKERQNRLELTIR